MEWLGAVVIVLGWVAMMASMERHADLFQTLPAAARSALRMLAWSAFAVSLALFVAARGVQQGPVYWTSCLMLGAIATVLAGAWVAQRMMRRR